MKATKELPEGLAKSVPTGLRAQVSTICSIGIERDATGTPTKLRVYPSTPVNPVIYHPVGNGNVAPERPTQVLWTVNRLRQGESIKIQRKQGVRAVFAWEPGPLVIAFPDQEATSGPAIGSLPADRGIYWEYSIKIQPTGHKKVDLDPVIIIDPGW